MSESGALWAVVRGFVQGVGFRFFVLRRARALGLRGYVRNLPGGHEVEVLAEGPKDRLEALLGELEVGPSGAWVERVEARWREPSGLFSEFKVEF